MITEKQYLDLWNDLMKNLPNETKLLMPSYEEYKVRETEKINIFKSFNTNCQIRYILLGEAVPKSGNFIYKDSKGSYITQPLKAMDTINCKAKNRLSKFTEHGFALLDLYPFALDYNKKFNKVTLRKILTLDEHFQERVFKLLVNEINSLTHLSENWDFCLVAPIITSLGFVSHLEKRKGGFLMSNKHVGHKNDLLKSPDFIDKGLKNYSDYTEHEIGHVPKKARLTVLIGGTGPNYKLIQRVFL